MRQSLAMDARPLLGAAGAFAAALASLRWNWWRPVRRGIPVLMYHKTGDYPAGTVEKNLWTTGDQFRRQLGYLKRRGYESLTLSELRDADTGKRRMPERPVLITFDDGFSNNFEIAYPALKEFGMKAVMFLACERLGGDSAWDAAGGPAIPMLTWPRALEMQASGVFEFGSHTLSHPKLPDLPLDAARREIAQSRKYLEDKLGREVLGFAYPHGAGAGRPEIRALVREAGYLYDFAVRAGVRPFRWRPEDGAIARINMRGDDTMLDLYLKLTRGESRVKKRFWRAPENY
ncbi:MAG: polysaccharide deacetylase family protein [Elusimicrobia bacterium]|nr:polysaccharide deacetylase family protein [Elusimicrobiota bacterium]